jgi:addiction module HigA family antidote
MGMSSNRLNELVKGKRDLTPENAILIGALTNTDPRFWLHLQVDHSLWRLYAAI